MILWAVVLAACVRPTLGDPPSHIRIGSFNIANLGDTKEYERSLISLANIIRGMDADLICLQEVEPNDLGHEQVGRLVKLLNQAANYFKTKPYQVAISDKSGDEATAFLWRAPVAMESEIFFLEHDEDEDQDGKPAFQRVPTYALFAAGNYDFYVVNCHLYTKIKGSSSEGRTVEYTQIVKWFDTLAEEAEKDAVIVGDFNRFLGGKSAWKTLMHEGHSKLFRFPLLEAIKKEKPSFDPLKHEAPEDRFSTTTSKKRSIYDQILIAKGSYHEFTEMPELGVDVGIIAFDEDDDYKWFLDNWADATKYLSDHRPIWVRVAIDRNDDD